MITEASTPAEPGHRSRPCAHCGEAVFARKPTGRPPLYCWADGKDCQALAKAERAAARTAGVTGGLSMVRQAVLDLDGQLDEAWEPLQALTQTVHVAREEMTVLRDQLLARAEQAEAAAEEAVTAKETADEAARRADLTREEALRQAADARTECAAAVRTRDEALRMAETAERARERALLERDNADRRATDASTREAAATAIADRRVSDATEIAATAREEVARLTAELAAAHRQRDEHRTQAEAAGAEAAMKVAAAESEVERVQAEAVAAADRQRADAEARAAARTTLYEQRLEQWSEERGALREQVRNQQATASAYAEILRGVRAALTAPDDDPEDSVVGLAERRVEAVLSLLAAAPSPL